MRSALMNMTDEEREQRMAQYRADMAQLDDEAMIARVRKEINRPRFDLASTAIWGGILISGLVFWSLVAWGIIEGVL